MTPSDNGAVATDGAVLTDGVEHGTTLASLRTTPENVHLLRGYGPLVVGLILFILMVTLAPTVAPERVVERPADAPAAEESP